MSDKNAVEQFLADHIALFGEGKLQSFTGDKGYYSSQNTKALEEQSIEDFHLGYHYEDQDDGDYHRLYSRRAGVEPVIGHIKRSGQLGKSVSRRANPSFQKVFHN